MRRHLYCVTASLILLALALAASSSSGQEPQNPPTGIPGSATASSSTGQTSQSPDSNVKPAVYAPTQLEVRPMGSSDPLPLYDTLLRWGPVYIRSIDLFQSYDQLGNVTRGAQGIFNQDSFNATILRTDIVYDHATAAGRFVVEYTPRVTIVNGHVSADFVNQSLGTNWVEPLSPRWGLELSDSFSYYRVRNLYGDYFLSVDTISGVTVPSSFLDSGGSWLSAGTQASFSYALSPTSSLSVSPGFAYSHTSGLVNGLEPTDGYQYSGTLGWKKQLSPNTSLQADYRYQLVQSFGTNVPYNNGDLGFSWQLGPSTTIATTVGVLDAGFATGSERRVSGSAQLAEKWGRFRASIGYYRGVSLFNELGSQGVSQMIQANYRVNLTPRWYWSAQGGYEDSITKNITNLLAKSASTEVGFQVSGQVSCFVSYGYTVQGGSTQALLAGNIHNVMGGIRWTAHAVQ